MRPVMQRVWRAAEETGSVPAVKAEWRSLLGDDFDAAQAYLRVLGVSGHFPCPSPAGRGCPRKIVERRGQLQAMCGDSPRVCETVVVSKDDILILEVRMEELATTTARTLGLEPHVSTSRPGGEIWSLGALALAPGSDLPAFFYSGRHAGRFDRGVGRLLRENAGAFLLIAARSLLASPGQTAGLRRRKCVLLAAEDVWLAADRGEPIDLRIEASRVFSRVAEGVREPETIAPEFRRVGRRWYLAFDGRAAAVKHSIGLVHIHALLSVPRKRIAAVELAGGDGARKIAWGELSEEPIDAKAKAAYKRRLAKIADQIEDAREFRKDEEVERLKEEQTAILAEVRTATALGGKIRTEPRALKRPRQTVAKGITRSFGDIEAEHPALARHLRASIRLGTLVSYEPECDIDWRL